MNAITPDWEMDRTARAIRGCSLSHLKAVKEAKGMVLVLEDDALPQNVEELKTLTFEAPEGEGIFLLGAEVLYSVSTGTGFYEVFLPYHGTQAVLYDAPLLKSNGWLLAAYENAATKPLKAKAVCYEQLIALACKDVGTRILRLPKMYFSTVEGFSDRTGEYMPPRSLNADDVLVPDSNFEPLLKELRGKSVVVIKPPGNVGDDLIVEGMVSLFKRNGIEHGIYDSKTSTNLPQADIYAYGGGGGVSGSWNHDHILVGLAKAVKPLGKKVIVFPQTIEEYRPHLDLADILFVREQTSFDMSKHKDTRIVPDFAFSIPLLKFPDPPNEKGVFLRDDIESFFPSHPKNDPRLGMKTAMDYVRSAARYREVETDCLHFAISALVAGRKAILLPNSYHKNKSIYETWKHLLPNLSWRSEPGQV
jgi:exopolysaccharide biosynthesis predicted pyruvyltransferase EpsI